MTSALAPARTRSRPHLAPRLVCLVGSLVLLAAAATGLTLWDHLPALPPPAANEQLLLLRRLVIGALGLLGLLSLPWAFRPAVLPLAGVAAHVLALFAAVAATVVLRGEAVAPLFWVPAVSSAAACLAVVWAAARPDRVRS